jgi:hypothetical protein
MRPKYLVAILVLLALTFPVSSAHAGGVVSVCDQAHLLTALSGGGTVTFSCSGWIALSSTISISADTTIDGSGQTITLSGESAVRVFSVNAGKTLNLKYLSVAYGKDTSSNGGGGVFSNGGKLTITNSAFHDNHALFGGGVMIYNGTLTVINSTFSGNFGSVGGGIASYDSTATISSSEFDVNSASKSNIAAGSGGGIFSEGGQLTVSNSTFYRNSADSDGGGIAGDNSTVAVTNCTFAHHSAGVTGNAIERTGGGSLVLRNTIVAYSTAGTNCVGSLTDGGGNLSYPDTSCPGINSNPRLLSLNANGGPTFTMLLDRGSPAIDAANDATCAATPVNNLDQRGVKRPQGSHCDIGAVEQKPYSVSPPVRAFLPVFRNASGASK